MEISLVPEIMNSWKIKIFDENNMPIQICEPSEFKFNFNRYKNPSFLIDNFEKIYPIGFGHCIFLPFFGGCESDRIRRAL